MLVAAALLALLGIATLIAWRLGWFDYPRVAAAARQLRHLDRPILAAAILVGVWAIAGTLGFPALPMMIAGGLLFGTLVGTTLNLIGTALGASGGYLLARTLARGVLERRLSSHTLRRELSRRRSFIAVARFRLLPVVPLAIGNFAAGLARMPYWPYLAGTLAGQLPSTLIYTYFASSIVNAAASGRSSVAARDGLIASGTMLALTVVPRILKRSR